MMNNIYQIKVVRCSAVTCHEKPCMRISKHGAMAATEEARKGDKVRILLLHGCINALLIVLRKRGVNRRIIK
jgi:hypothetical protein